MTAEQLAELPDDGRRHELIDGDLTTTPPAGGEYGSVTRNIGAYVATRPQQAPGRIAGPENGIRPAAGPEQPRPPISSSPRPTD